MLLIVSSPPRSGSKGALVTAARGLTTLQVFDGHHGAFRHRQTLMETWPGLGGSQRDLACFRRADARGSTLAGKT
jgi:hypothetical protein